MANETHIHAFLQKQVPDPAADDMMGGYLLIKQHTEALGFQHYSDFIERVFCSPESRTGLDPRLEAIADGQKKILRDPNCELTQNHFCFTGTKAYDQLREATDLFIGAQVALSDDCCRAVEDEDGVTGPKTAELARSRSFGDNIITRRACYDLNLIKQRFEYHSVTEEQLQALYRRIFDAPGGGTECCTDGVDSQPGNVPATKGSKGAAAASDDEPGKRERAADRDRDRNERKWGHYSRTMRPAKALTFMQQLMQNQSGVPLKDCNLGSGNCSGMLLCKISCPPLLELIWSYWMEQGMLVQGINSLSFRFQNRRYPGHEGLQRCDIPPLRPLNNFFWGYVQREQDRLSVARRAYEYDHHYGLRIRGAAVPKLAPGIRARASSRPSIACCRKPIATSARRWTPR